MLEAYARPWCAFLKRVRGDEIGNGESYVANNTRTNQVVSNSR